MKKKSNGIGFWLGVSTLLFGAGAVWSPLFVSAIKDSKGVFEVVSYIATTVAAIVAVITLTAWKRQFLTQTRYSEIKALRSAYWGLRMVSRLVTAYAMWHAEDKLADEEESPRLKERDDLLRDAHDEWVAACAAYLKAWVEASHFVQDENFIKRYNPSSIRSIFPVFKNEVRLATSFDPVDSSEVFSCCLSLSGKKNRELDEYFLRGDEIISAMIREVIR